MMTLIYCQDHILTENIWFVWSKTSYCGDKWRCHRCGTNKGRGATQPMQCNGCWGLSFAIIKMLEQVDWVYDSIPFPQR